MTISVIILKLLLSIAGLRRRGQNYTPGILINISSINLRLSKVYISVLGYYNSINTDLIGRPCTFLVIEIKVANEAVNKGARKNMKDIMSA